MTAYDTLKEREIQILRLMSEHLTNREIAERLFIGVETVRWYAKQIYSKLGVSGREEAATKAQQLGLLDEQQSTPTHTQIQPRHNLPLQLNSFIGREQQISEIGALLAETRLLTLTGSGGTGKTRLSLKVAEDHLDAFTDGVYFVDLVTINKPALVTTAIANTLGVVETPNQSFLACLKTAIGQRDMLLILDNFEHVIEAAGVVLELLTVCPNLKIMVTTREALRITGEQVYPVPALTLKDHQQPEESEAVLLFVQRSQAVKPHFQLDDTNKQTIIEICQHLDGLPLAIELAAAQSRLLSPDAILKRMMTSFQSLKNGLRDAPARQQTIEATIDWSYNLLNEAEKSLFVRLAVFRRGRSLQAIEAVCGDDLGIDVFEGLAALVDKNMVYQLECALGEPRFYMLETMHDYAVKCLNKRSETNRIKCQHARYFADLTDHARRFLRQSSFEYWFSKLTLEYDNIRAALHWSLAADGDTVLGLRMVGAMRDFWFYEGYHVEGQRWTEQALELLDTTDDPHLQARVLRTAATMAYLRQDVAQSAEYLNQAIVLMQSLGKEPAVAIMSLELAQNLYDMPERTPESYETTRAMGEQALATLAALGNQQWYAQGLNILGNIYERQGLYQLAHTTYDQCLQVVRQTGERRREVIVLGNLIAVAIGLGNDEVARQYAIESLRLARDIRFTYVVVVKLGSSVPSVLLRFNQPEAAAQLYAASRTMQAKMNLHEQPVSKRKTEQMYATMRDQLSDETFQAAYDTGCKMSLDEAITFALQALDNAKIG